MNNEELIVRIKELENSSDINDNFMAFELICEIFSNELLDDFLSNFKEKLYKNNPVRFIGLHIHFYLNQDKILEALNQLKIYQDAAFISLEVDDFMKDLEKEIQKVYSKNKTPKYDLYQAEKDLYSNNEGCVIKAIHYLSKINIRLNISLFEEALTSSISYYYKILLQFLLIEQSINQEFKVTDKDTCFYFNPSKTNLPFDRVSYKKVSKYINHLNEEPSIIQTAIELLNTMEVRLFPKSIIDECVNEENTGEIFVFLAKRFLMQNPLFSTLIFNTQMNEIDLNRLLNKITTEIQGQ